MSTKFHLLILFIFLARVSYGQWIQQNTPTAIDLNAVNFVNEECGLTVGNNGLILKTTNGGENWDIVESNTTANLLTVDFVDESNAFIGGDSGTLLSVNINTNQKEFYNVNSDLQIRRIEFVNSSSGYFVTMKKVFKSTNSGISWNEIYTGSDYLFSVNFRDENIGLISGKSFMLTYEVIKSTTDGGLSWNIWGSYDLGTLYDIYCIDDSTAYAINDWYFCKTVGARRMNIAYYFNDTYSLNKMFFINEMKGWVVSTGSWPQSGRIYSTYNGGINWSVDSVNTQFPLSLNDIFFINDNIGWAVGGGGSVFRTDSGSINYIDNKWINNKIQVFTLEQNYPNPFNASTIIKYEISSPGKVEIKVYNMLGKKIAVLVEDYKDKGIHEVRFDCNNLPTGIYIYRMISGNHSVSKKMLLMK